MNKDEIIKLDLTKTHKNNYCESHTLIIYKDLSLETKKENGEEVGYPDHTYFLKKGEKEIFYLIDPNFGLKEIHWDPKKNLSSKEITKIFIDLIPIARKEFVENRKESYRNCPEFYINNKINIKETLREEINKKAIIKLSEIEKSVLEFEIQDNWSEKELGIDYENLNFVTINLNSLAMGLSIVDGETLKEYPELSERRVSFYFKNIGSKTFQEVYKKTTGIDMNEILKEINFPEKKELFLIQQINL